MRKVNAGLFRCMNKICNIQPENAGFHTSKNKKEKLNQNLNKTVWMSESRLMLVKSLGTYC